MHVRISRSRPLSVDGVLIKIPCSVMSLGGLLMVNMDVKVIFIIFHLALGIDILNANVIASFEIKNRPS